MASKSKGRQEGLRGSVHLINSSIIVVVGVRFEDKVI